MDSAEIIPDDDFLVIREEIVDAAIGDNEQCELQQTPKTTKIVPFFEPNDYLNGALYDEKNYCWSQTRNEIGKYSGLFVSIYVSIS